jgi:hypothetical protein
MPTGKVFLCKLRWELDPFSPVTLPGYHEIVVRQSERFPFGAKGHVLAGLWTSLEQTGSDGIIINDNDVIIDPHDQAAMMRSVKSDPMVVWTAPVKIWPHSTDDKSWSWCHGETQGVRNQIDTDSPTWFGFGFTYLPSRLLDASMAAGLAQWKYPWVDTKVGEMARSMEIGVKVVRNGCYPKHLNFTNWHS